MFPSDRSSLRSSFCWLYRPSILPIGILPSVLSLSNTDYTTFRWICQGGGIKKLGGLKFGYFRSNRRLEVLKKWVAFEFNGVVIH